MVIGLRMISRILGHCSIYSFDAVLDLISDLYFSNTEDEIPLISVQGILCQYSTWVTESPRLSVICAVISIESLVISMNWMGIWSMSGAMVSSPT